MQLPDSVLIREVGPRDGLQNEQIFISTKDKVKVIKKLLSAGISAIEATSFVHPQAVPQMRDAEEVLRELRDISPGVTLSALVGNVKGMERALSTLVNEVMFVMSASKSHNQANFKMTVAQSLSILKDISKMAEDSGIMLRGAVATSFGCPYQGKVTIEEIRKVVEEMLICGVREITLADTAGMGNPRQVGELLKHLKRLYPGVAWALHFHDNHGLGLANTLAGLAAGVTTFESSFGGLGGCPFIPDAAGNVATEDLVNMLHEMGLTTGIELYQLCQCTSMLEELLKKKLPAKVNFSGSCKE